MTRRAAQPIITIENVLYVEEITQSLQELGEALPPTIRTAVKKVLDHETISAGDPLPLTEEQAKIVKLALDRTMAPLRYEVHYSDLNKARSVFAGYALREIETVLPPQILPNRVIREE